MPESTHPRHGVLATGTAERGSKHARNWRKMGPEGARSDPSLNADPGAPGIGAHLKKPRQRGIRARNAGPARSRHEGQNRRGSGLEQGRRLLSGEQGAPRIQVVQVQGGVFYRARRRMPLPIRRPVRAGSVFGLGHHRDDGVQDGAPVRGDRRHAHRAVHGGLDERHV